MLTACNFPSRVNKPHGIPKNQVYCLLGLSFVFIMRFLRRML
jgi:hypothetical protein